MFVEGSLQSIYPGPLVGQFILEIVNMTICVF
jgi:hypothetical protein